MVKSGDTTFKPSMFTIKLNQFIRFIKVGISLHVIMIFGIWLFFVSLQKLLVYQSREFQFYIWLLLAWIGFILPFFSEFDAFGRYQNYKLVKDKLYTLGYDDRIVRPFMYSNCQRFAILIAAIDLKCSDQVKKFFLKNGYNWYHILPDTWIRDPFLLFTKCFWEKILFTKYYKLQNFYW